NPWRGRRKASCRGTDYRRAVNAQLRPKIRRFVAGWALRGKKRGKGKGGVGGERGGVFLGPGALPAGSYGFLCGEAQHHGPARDTPRKAVKHNPPTAAQPHLKQPPPPRRASSTLLAHIPLPWRLCFRPCHSHTSPKS